MFMQMAYATHALQDFNGEKILMPRRFELQEPGRGPFKFARARGDREREREKESWMTQGDALLKTRQRKREGEGGRR